MSGLRRINLKQVAFLLGMNCKRTAENWCKRNDVLCFMDGRTKYVYLPEFEAALDKDFIQYVKVKYPDKSQEIYEAACNRDIEMLNELKSADFNSYQRYVPKSSAAKKFLN